MKRPLDTACPVCEVVFQQPVRRQGGGARQIYCTPRCRSLDWVRGHAKSRKASVLSYENKPENKERKRTRARERNLRKYGLTPSDVETMLQRQQGRCAGCNRELPAHKACIDHNHATGSIRGLLCSPCNLALGCVEDTRARLYQLAAYLELDRTRPVLYLIGSLRNPQVPVIGNELRALGFEVVDNWFAAGKIADDAWRDYSTLRKRTYTEALQSREANNVFYFDRAYLALADIAVLLYPAGKSAHLEFGWALGQGKTGYVLLEPCARYDTMLQFAGPAAVYQAKEPLYAALKERIPS